MHRHVLSVTVIVMWGVLLLGGAFRPESPAVRAAPQPEVGYHAPNLSVTDAAGNRVNLESYHGKAVFLNFWASWCGPCRIEMPEIERLAQKLPTGAAVLTVNVTNQEDSIDAVADFLRNRDYSFPVVYDREGSTAITYLVAAMPTSLFISPEGVVTARIHGPMSYAVMRDYLAAAGR